MSAPSPIEQSCRHCGFGRRVDGTIVDALPGIVCPGHDLQTHQLQPTSATGPGGSAAVSQIKAFDDELICRISSSILCLSYADGSDNIGTAIVWDYSDDDVLILTNYHTWDDEEFRYCFPPDTKNTRKRKAPNKGYSSRKAKTRNKSDDFDEDDEAEAVKLKFHNEYGFVQEFSLSSDLFFRFEKDEDYAVLRLPKHNFTMPRIPITLNISLTLKVRAFGYIGHTSRFNISGGEVAGIIPEGFVMNLLYAGGFSGAAIVADGYGRAVGYMGENLDAGDSSNLQHQLCGFRFDRVILATKRQTTPTSSPDRKVSSK